MVIPAPWIRNPFSGYTSLLGWWPPPTTANQWEWVDAAFSFAHFFPWNTQPVGPLTRRLVQQHLIFIGSAWSNEDSSTIFSGSSPFAIHFSRSFSCAREGRFIWQETRNKIESWTIWLYFWICYENAWKKLKTYTKRGYSPWYNS